MYRTHNCGALRLTDAGKEVTLSGWVNTTRPYGQMTFVDLRDRYGVTQAVFENNEALNKEAMTLGREYVIRIVGTVRERTNKNPNISTGDIEIEVKTLEILNVSKTPPFTIKDDTDGGDDIRMKYRYLDLRRAAVQKNLFFRSQVAIEVRKYLSGQDFIEVETPNLIKSTPEGARDFVVPSRMNAGQFYALPQSPQTFKQLLMVSGFDKYFQIVKCFRDEDLRADRQPEFTQIDCEMSFVTQEDILNTFEGLTKHVFKTALNVELADFPRMTYDEAASKYGSDKPDIRFGMEFVELNDIAKGKGFPVFDSAEFVVGICAKGVASAYSNKTMNELTDFVKRPQIGAKGLVYIKFEEDGTVKSPIAKFYSEEQLQEFGKKCGAEKGDVVFILSGETDKTRKQLSELRLELGNRLFLRVPKYGLRITNLKEKVKSLSENQNSIYGLRIKPETKISERNIKDLIKPFNDKMVKANTKLNVSVHSTSRNSTEKNTYLNENEVDKVLTIREVKNNELYIIFAGDGNIFSLVNEFRSELGKVHNLHSADDFKPLWVVDFPLLEWDEETQRFYAMHHPFTSPKREQIPSMLNGDHETMKNLRADAYDLVLNGVEIGGGSIRIYDRELQSKNFTLLGMTEEEAESKFGFLLGAFEYGAPPHGGIAFGFDRLCAVMSGVNSIRDFIAFPKNNQGRDVMIDAPSFIEETQLTELSIALNIKE